MKEVNKCALIGCKGKCCENITIYNAEEVIVRTFPNAIELNAYQMQQAINGKMENGVYFIYDGSGPIPGMVLARIVGGCPNRLANGNCSRHHRCSHAAENFEFGSPDCLDILAEQGLEL